MGAVAPRPYAEWLGRSAPPVRAVSLLTVCAAAAVGATALVHPLAPLPFAAVAVGLAAAWRRPLVAAVAAVAVVPAVSGIGRGVGVPFFKPSEALLLLSFAVVVLHRPPLKQRFRAVDWSLAAFAAAGAVFAAIHVLSGASSPGTFVRVGLQPTMLLMTWWTASRAIGAATDLRVVLRWLLLLSPIPAGLSVLQALDAPGVRHLLIRLTQSPLPADPGVPGVIRVTGPFPIWHSLAAYLLVPAVVGVMLLLRRDRSVLPTLVVLVVLAVDVAALVLAVTITVIAWAVVAILVVGLLQRRLAEAAALLVVAGVATAILFADPIAARINAQFETPTATNQVPQTISYRIEVWRRDFVPLLDRSVADGVSNELPQSVIFQNTENQYISLMLRGGVLLLLSGAAACALAAAASATAARRHDDLPGAAAGAALGVVLFLPVACMVWPYLTNAGFPQAWLALAGAAVAAAGAREPTAAPGG